MTKGDLEENVSSGEDFQRESKAIFENHYLLRESLLEIMSQEEWSKPKNFTDVRSKPITIYRQTRTLHTLMTLYSVYKYNINQNSPEEMLNLNQAQRNPKYSHIPLSSRAVLDDILNIAGIQNRWHPSFENVDLRNRNYVRKILLNAEHADGSPVTITEIKEMNAWDWRTVRVKDPEIGLDKALRSLVQYFTAFDYWKTHPKYSLNHVVQKRKKGKVNKKALNEVLEFAGL